MLPAPVCSSSLTLGTAGPPPALPANLLLHTRCWQQLHPHTLKAHGQGFMAAAFAHESTEQGVLQLAGEKLSSPFPVIPSLQFALLTTMEHCIELFIEIFMIKPRSCLRVVMVTAKIFPTHVNSGLFFLSIYAILHLPTLSFTFYFPASSLRAARSFCNSVQAALILAAPNDSVSSAKVCENGA